MALKAPQLKTCHKSQLDHSSNRPEDSNNTKPPGIPSESPSVSAAAPASTVAAQPHTVVAGGILDRILLVGGILELDMDRRISDPT
jgi:hypothetical protein